MSGKVINAVLDAGFTRAETLVLISIANHTDDRGRGCFANMAKLAYHTKVTNLSRLRATLNSLVERGVVIERHDPRAGDVWDIDLEKLKRRSFHLWKKEEYPALVAKRQEPSGQNVRKSLDFADKMSVEVPSDSLVPACGQNVRTILILRPKEKNLRPRVYARGQKSPTGQEEPMPQRYADSELEYVSDDEEETAAKAKDLPETDLQRKVAALSNSKYLSRDMKGKLRSTVTVTLKKGLPTTQPSPEDEWRARPDWFAEYVELCAQRIQEESLRPPSRAKLIESIRVYGRPNTGWLAFKAAKELAERTREAQRPPAVRRHFSSDPNAPAWRQ